MTGVQPERTDALNYILLDNPYVRPGFQVETPRMHGSKQVVEINVGLYRAEHLQHLIAQLTELDFEATVIPR